MEHIYIFDYSTGDIYHGKITTTESWEEYLKNHNLKESNCEVMVVQNKKNIIEL